MPFVVALHRRAGVTGPSLPKPSSARLEIRADGVQGDRNRYRQRRRSGDPAMAVSLLASETLAQLQAEGWPVRAGDLGENLTIEGLAPACLTPGVRLAIGVVQLELTFAIEPCRTLVQLPYVGPGRLLAFQRALRGRRGFYARVSHEGVVQVGDEVSVRSPEST